MGCRETGGRQAVGARHLPLSPGPDSAGLSVRGTPAAGPESRAGADRSTGGGRLLCPARMVDQQKLRVCRGRAGSCGRCRRPLSSLPRDLPPPFSFPLPLRTIWRRGADCETLPSPGEGAGRQPRSLEAVSWQEARAAWSLAGVVMPEPRPAAGPRG